MSSLAPRADEPGRCRNCGAPRLAPYCGSCGQPETSEQRITFRTLGAWLLNHVLDLDRGVLLTAREMTLRPGNMIRRYLEGQRQRYTNPVTYVLIGIGLSLVAWKLLGSEVLAQMKAQAASNVAPLHLTPAQTARFVQMQMTLLEYTQQITLLLCLPITVFLRWFFPRAGLNLAEHLIVAMFAMGHFCLLMLPVYLVAMPLHAGYMFITIVTMALMAVVYTQTALGVYGRRVGVVIKTLLALTLSTSTFAVLQELIPILLMKPGR